MKVHLFYDVYNLLKDLFSCSERQAHAIEARAFNELQDDNVLTGFHDREEIGRAHV